MILKCLMGGNLGSHQFPPQHSSLLRLDKEIKMNIVVMMRLDKTQDRTGQISPVEDHDGPDVVVRMMVMIFSSSSCSSIIITLVLRAEG